MTALLTPTNITSSVLASSSSSSSASPSNVFFLTFRPTLQMPGYPTDVGGWPDVLYESRSPGLLHTPVHPSPSHHNHHHHEEHRHHYRHRRRRHSRKHQRREAMTHAQFDDPDDGYASSSSADVNANKNKNNSINKDALLHGNNNNNNNNSNNINDRPGRSDFSLWEERQKRILGLAREESKKRRSVNFRAPGKPREAQLYNVNGRSLIEVRPDGSVATTEKTDSPYSIFRVIYLCSLLALTSLQNCSDSLRYSEKLFFVESQRYLCMGGSRNLYTDAEGGNNSDCTLRHEFLTNKYDIYYSDSYPASLDRCRSDGRRETAKRDGADSTHLPPPLLSPTPRSPRPLRDSKSRPESRAGTARSGRKSRTSARSRTCDSRWYLAVGTGSQDPRVVVTSGNRTRKEAFFIQRWRHRSGANGTSYLGMGVALGSPRWNPGGEAGRRREEQQVPAKRPGKDSNHARPEGAAAASGSSLTRSKTIPFSSYVTASSYSSSSSPSSLSSSSSSSLSSSSSSPTATSSPLRRTRSSFVNSQRYKSDRRASVECSNLLRVNCTGQQTKGSGIPEPGSQ